MQMPVRVILEILIFSPFIFIALSLLIWFWPIRKKDHGHKRKILLRRNFILWMILFLGSSTGFYRMFSFPLKQIIPVSEKKKAGAIVIVSGGVHESGAPTPSSTIRAHSAAQLYLEGWAPIVLVSGGVTKPYIPPIDKKGIHIVLLGLGIPSEAIWIENQSIDTYTNGVESTKILHAKGITTILLVSHDYHLPRAKAVFEKLGMTVIPYAANQYALNRSENWWLYFSWKNYNRLQTIAHEYFGLLLYSLTGKT